MSTTTISTVVHRLGENGWEAHYSLPPKGAVLAAYAQFERGDYETWNYAKYEAMVQEGHFTVWCGDFVALKTGKAPTSKEIREYVKSNHEKAKAARDAQSD